MTLLQRELKRGLVQLDLEQVAEDNAGLGLDDKARVEDDLARNVDRDVVD